MDAWEAQMHDGVAGGAKTQSKDYKGAQGLYPDQSEPWPCFVRKNHGCIKQKIEFKKIKKIRKNSVNGLPDTMVGAGVARAMMYMAFFFVAG